MAALVVIAQAAGVMVATILAGLAAATGRSYLVSSGIAITVIGAGTAVGLGFLAAGLARARRWSRTPALMTQFFVAVVGIYLVQGGRYWWGVPALVLSAAGFVLLLVPPSTRALTT